MMAVGDQQFFVGHQRFDGRGVQDRPDAMAGSIFVEDVQDRLALFRFAQDRIDGVGRVRIEHEDLAEMRARVVEKFPAILLGTGQRLFVAKNDVSGIIFHLAEADEALASEALARIGHLELLEIGVKTGCGILRQNALANPILEVLGGARVDVVGGVVEIATLAQNHANQIVRAGGQILRCIGGLILS